MNKKTVTLTEVERSFLIVELQKKYFELMNKYANEKTEAAYYILSDADFVGTLLAKIKWGEEQ